MRVCTICDKGSIIVGKRRLLRGHYNLTKTSRKYPNLQWVRLGGPQFSISAGSVKPLGPARQDIPGPKAGKRVKACAQCIKKLHA